MKGLRNFAACVFMESLRPQMHRTRVYCDQWWFGLYLKATLTCFAYVTEEQRAARDGWQNFGVLATHWYMSAAERVHEVEQLNPGDAGTLRLEVLQWGLRQDGTPEYWRQEYQPEPDYNDPPEAK